MRRVNGSWQYCLAAGILAGLWACGSNPDDGFKPEPVPTPTPCTQTVVDSDSGSIPAHFAVYYDFSVPDSGRLDVTLDWTLPTSAIAFYLVPANTCTVPELNARSCNFLIRSEPSTQKPKKISTPNFAAGNYRWIIGNASDVDESVAYQIVLSKGGCAALSGTPPAVSGIPDSLAEFAGMQRR